MEYSRSGIFLNKYLCPIFLLSNCTFHFHQSISMYYMNIEAFFFSTDADAVESTKGLESMVSSLLSMSLAVVCEKSDFKITRMFI